MNRHLHNDRLGALLEPDLNRDSRREADAHLEQCAACGGRLQELESVRVRLAADAASLIGSTSLEERVMGDVLERPARHTRPAQGAPGRLREWLHELHRHAPSRRALIPATAAVAILVVFFGAVVQRSSEAWTLEQSVAAARPMQGVYLDGTLDGHVGVRIWIRGRPDRTHVADMLLRADNGLTIHVRGNRTVYHMAGEPTAYTDDAQTAGFTPWPGAAFLDLLRKVSSAYQIDSRVDLLHMRRVTILRAQLVDAEGPKSFELEFDPYSKLPTRLMFWRNLQRSGEPAFAASVEYHTEMPDALFASDLPATIVYRERPVSIPDEMVGLLAAGAGVELSGSEQAGSRQIVEDVYRAVVGRDLARVRALAPVTTLWSDAQLEAVFGGAGGQDNVTELVGVGEARRRGASPLGPLMVVPVVVRHRDGQLYDEKMIVQIRTAPAGGSCVVFGPYGRPYPSGV